MGDVSSVGSERLLHTQEVTGSNPVRPTMISGNKPELKNRIIELADELRHRNS